MDVNRWFEPRRSAEMLPSQCLVVVLGLGGVLVHGDKSAADERKGGRHFRSVVWDLERRAPGGLYGRINYGVAALAEPPRCNDGTGMVA